MIMYDIIKDLSCITCVASDDIMKLSDISGDIICDYATQKIKEGNNRIDIDMQLGVLSIINTPEGIKYKFVGSKDFDTNLRKAYSSGKSPLKKRAEKAIMKRLKLMYKELL